MQLKPFALFLFALQWTTITSGVSGPPAACCQRTFDMKMNVAQIVAYTHQDLPLCPVKAVRFFTTSGRSICSDPESLWTKRAIQLVNTRKSTQAPPEDLSFIADNPGQELIIVPEYTNDDPMVRRRSPRAGPSPGCCNKIVSTKIQVDKILSYVHQDSALCPVRAVRLTTIKNKLICSDPESNWTKFAMCVVDTRKSTKEAELTCRGLTAGSWTKPPLMTTTIIMTSKSTASTMFTTPSLPTGSTTATYTTHTSSIMTEPPSTTKTTQRTTPGTTQGTSTEMKTTTPSVPTTVTLSLTYPPSLTPTKTQNPSQTSTNTTVVKMETPKVTRLPWTLKRLKKKSKSGLRKAQKKNR